MRHAKQRGRLLVTASCLIALGFNIGGCIRTKYHPGEEVYQEVVRVPISNQEGRAARLRTYNIDAQLDAYLFAMCCVEPSDAAFLRYMEDNGESKIQQIATKIAVTKDWGDKTNLMRLLERIDWKCECVANG